MGSVTFTDSYQISSYGYYEQNVEVNFTESYNSATNKTTVTLSSIRMKSEYAGGSSPVYGDVSFSANGSSWTSVKSMSGGSNQVNLATSYSTIDGSSGGSLDITHATDGTATLYVRLSGGSGGYWGAQVHTYGKPSRMFGIETPDTESTSLTTHTQKLTVNPNGGSWGGSTSSQSFNQAPLSTKTIADPTRTGYTFTGWTTSGGGSLSGTTYTFGSSDGTLTANWRINTWTVSYNANGHGTAPASQTKSYNVSLTLQQFISNQTGSGTTSNYTVTGNANGGTWSGSNGSATKRPNYTYSQTYWNSNSAGTGTNYSSKGAYTANAAATLYAIWKTTTSYSYTYTLPTGTPAKNQSVTVTFNANGGSTTKSSQSSTRAMTFNGWYTAASGGTKRTTSSQISANETVYAQYGNGTSAYPNVVLPTAAQCTRTGYNLLGFATSSSATTATYAPGAAYTPTATTTLYAVWQKLTYTLSLTKSDTGILVNVNRTSSPIGGASTGLLSNGATLYYNDVIKVSWSINSGYTAQTLTINNVDVSAYSPPEKTETITANLTVVMTVKLGALVYIDTAAYQAFLDDGVSYSQYEAYIDNGASWDAY